MVVLSYMGMYLTPSAQSAKIEEMNGLFLELCKQAVIMVLVANPKSCSSQREAEEPHCLCMDMKMCIRPPSWSV